ncbi:OmpH family outer membrane protein [Sphingomonas naphthae]|uniref:OmpH family outer membrane protein n=1 Tax=Sphingomonas naphthae TaxID=1813468 RepID=A0ABY7TQW8_9SPHN|nr:OmpH family outer membrane protein [Sphingomonas naphthae]WCT75071.1 OmpH family outer membrane protein [Sphingomonas naphthae]
MKIMFKAAIAAVALMAVPAFAQVATANLDAAVANSAAMKAARTQIQTQYKAQIDASAAREQALQKEIQPLASELQTLQAAGNTPPATLQAKTTAYQTRIQSAQRELQTLSLPFARPNAYAQEQVAAKLDQAVRQAMTAKNVVLLVQPESVLAAAPAGDLTGDITTQLDALVKTASIAVPANWQPGQSQQAAAPAPAAAGTAKPAAGR